MVFWGDYGRVGRCCGVEGVVLYEAFIEGFISEHRELEMSRFHVRGAVICWCA